MVPREIVSGWWLALDSVARRNRRVEVRTDSGLEGGLQGFDVSLFSDRDSSFRDSGQVMTVTSVIIDRKPIHAATNYSVETVLNFALRMENGLVTSKGIKTVLVSETYKIIIVEMNAIPWWWVVNLENELLI